MNFGLKIIWPLSIGVLLALLVLRQGSVGFDNPLGHSSLDRFAPLSKR